MPDSSGSPSFYGQIYAVDSSAATVAFIRTQIAKSSVQPTVFSKANGLQPLAAAFQPSNTLELYRNDNLPGFNISVLNDYGVYPTTIADVNVIHLMISSNVVMVSGGHSLCQSMFNVLDSWAK
jgi:hypothetical protein